MHALRCTGRITRLNQMVWHRWAWLTDTSSSRLQKSIKFKMSTNSSSKPSDGYKNAFHSKFPELVRDLTEDGLKNPEMSDGIQHLKDMMNYTVPGGKCNRGLMVVSSLCHLVKEREKRELTAEEESNAIILGWCIEWLQAFFLVADDIMDQSKLRRGRKCWYLKEGIGLIAINDSFCLEGQIYQVLRKHFRNEPYYTDILDLFHEVSYQTEIGQTLDILTSPDDHVDFSRFSLERYNAIIKYKTAFYSFYLPVALSLYMVGISDEKTHVSAKTILLKMGEFFQIQDDFLDCYGDPVVTGKVGTDIEENKCSWLVVQALERVTPEQRKVLQDNYGRKAPPECAARVKDIYKELNLEQVYHEYEERSYKSLMELIETEATAASLPKALFVEFANRIYKRNA